MALMASMARVAADFVNEARDAIVPRSTPYNVDTARLRKNDWRMKRNRGMRP
jgi:hypothetical protein